MYYVFVMFFFKVAETNPPERSLS